MISLLPVNMAEPKSHTLITLCPLLMRMLSGLMSACSTPHWRMRCSAISIWAAIDRTASSRSPMPCPYFFVSCRRLDSCGQ